MAYCQGCSRFFDDSLSICPYCKKVDPNKVKEFAFSEILTSEQTPTDPRLADNYKYTNIKVVLTIVALMLPLVGFIAGLVLVFNSDDELVKYSKVLLIISGALIGLFILIIALMIMGYAIIAL